MFTGMISGIGKVIQAQHRSEGLEMTIECPYPDLTLGESVAVDGACLTVETASANTLSVRVVPTTLERTCFGDYLPGRRVNLERAVLAGERLGGHLVQAHVDGVGTVEGVVEGPGTRLLNVRAPAHVARLSAPLGSITVDGVSLTVNAMPSPAVIQISLIPFTLQNTTLGERSVGDRVHLEGDAIAKYVAALLGKVRER